MTNFDTALTYLLENEGTTFSDLSADRGGACRYGVTGPILAKYLGKPVSSDDIKNLDFPTIRDLYLKLFWTPLRADEIPLPIATALFDTAVNRGQGIAVGLAQSCLPGLKVDNIIGDKTISALSSTDHETFIFNYLRALLAAYIELCLHAPSQLVFLKGWANRACRLFLLVER